MAEKLLKTLKEIIGILPHDERSYLENQELLKFSNEEILTPIGNILPLLLSHTSKLEDQFVNMDLIAKLAGALNKKQSIIRLNHIGFCYKVDSLIQEKERLTRSIESHKLYLYQEPSNDEGLWLFVGDADKWEKPVVEFVPIEKTNDQRADYWLPHIQIDLDTTLNGQEIDVLVKSIFGDSITPFHITIDGVVYIIRNRLGVIDGVNIMLDLATNKRNVKVLRQEIWNKIG